MKIETLSEPELVTAASSLLSWLKSARATAVGWVPTAKVPPPEKVPSPAPAMVRSWLFFESVTATSTLPSALMSASASAVNVEPPAVFSCDCRAKPNPPPTCPGSTLTRSAVVLAATMSGRPSPLTSAMATLLQVAAGVTSRKLNE